MPQPPAATVSISIAIVARPAESDCNEAVVEAIVEIVVLDEMIVVMPIVAMPSTVALVPGNVTTALPTSIPTRELAAMPIFATMSARHMTPREVGAPHASTKVRAAHAAPEVGAAHASTEPTPWPALACCITAGARSMLPAKAATATLCVLIVRLLGFVSACSRQPLCLDLGSGLHSRMGQKLASHRVETT